MFYAVEPSLELALPFSAIACNYLMLFIVSCSQAVWLFIILLPWLFGMCIFSSAHATSVLPAWTCHCSPRGSSWFSLPLCSLWFLLHILLVSRLVLSLSCSHGLALPVQEMSISARARFSKWVSLPAVTSLKPSGETSSFLFHASVGKGHILCSHHRCYCTDVGLRMWAGWDCVLMMAAKGTVREVHCVESWDVCACALDIFPYKRSGGPLGGGERRVTVAREDGSFFALLQ